MRASAMAEQGFQLCCFFDLWPTVAPCDFAQTIPSTWPVGIFIGHFSAAEGYKWFQYSVPPNSGSDRLLLEWSASQLNGLSLFSSRVNCNYPILSFYFWSNLLFWLLTLRSSHVAMENPSVVDDTVIPLIKAFIYI